MTAEAGQAPNRVYISQQGDLHLNGGKVYDVNETDTTSAVNIGSVTATPAELNVLHSVVAGTTLASSGLVVGASKNLDTLLLTVATDRLLRLSPQPTDTYASTMTIDVTYSAHFIAGANGTSATVAFTPSAAGTAGDVLVIVTAADSSGTVTATFSSTFHPSGTQATTLSHFSAIAFISDGTRWVELFRTTALA